MKMNARIIFEMIFWKKAFEFGFLEHGAHPTNQHTKSLHRHSSFVYTQ